MSRSRPLAFPLAPLLLLAALPGQSPADGLPDPLRERALGAYGGFVDADGVIRGEGANYRATFAATAAIEVASGDAGDPVAELRVRFTEARRGATRLPRDAAAQPTLAGEIVRWQHGPVTETYTLQAGGFEQSFVFAERPAGDGDLVVEIAAGGNVTAPATERAAHQPIEWRHGERSAIRYGEAFALDRTGARLAIATAFDGNGRITLTVPAAFVDAADLPLVVDPAIGFTLLPAGSSESDTQPDVAYDPTNDRYLFVWRRAFASGATGIRGAVYSGDGTVVNSLIDIATSGTFAHEVREPCACLLRSLDPDGFVVAWTDENNNPGTVTDGIRARVLNSLGNPLAPAIAVNFSTAPLDSKPTISGPDGAIMIAWQSMTTSGIYSIRFRDLHWTNPLDPTAVTMGVDRVIASVPLGEQVRNPRLARSNARHLLGSIPLSANRLVWERYHPTPAPGHTDVWTTSFYVDATSLLTAQAAAVVPGADQAGVNESAPDIGSMGIDWTDAASMLFLVAWADNGDIRAQRYSMSGPIGSNITVRATPNAEGAPAVAAGQTEWTVGYLELPSGAALDLDVYAAHVRSNGTVASDHNLVDAPGVVLQSGLRAASQPLPIAGQFPRNATMFAWSGRTGPASGIDDIRARRFEPIAGFVSPWGFSCQGPGGTLPTIGTIGGGPTPGTPGWAVTLSNAPPNSLAVLVFGNDPIDVPIGGTNNCRLYTNLPFLTMLPAFTSPSGSAQIALPVPVGIPLFPWQMQWGVETPGWNAFGWISSDDLDVYFTE